MDNKIREIPYPKPPLGIFRKIYPFLKNGGLSALTADQLIEDGINWASVSPFVQDHDWWLKQKPNEASNPRLDWKIQTWDATICIQVSGLTIYVDPGPTTPNPIAPPDFIIITHAHHDHTAKLYQWANSFHDSRIVMSVQTAKLLSLQTAQDPILQSVIQRAITLDYKNGIKIYDLNINLLPAGHLLGAAMVELGLDSEKILISGDFALREVGGVPGALIPDEEYALVLLATNASGSDWLPGMDVKSNRMIFLNAIFDQIEAGKNQIFVPVQSLGQAQEAYSALILAQRAGAFKKHKIYLKGHVAEISKLYAHELSKQPGPWNTPFLEIKNQIPENSIILLPNSEDREFYNETEEDQVSDNMSKGILSKPLLFSHAGWGEQLTFALGICCSKIMIYHGWNLFVERTLISTGRKMFKSIS